MYDPNYTDAELLQRYLAVRNAKCPTCGYNLRDGRGDRCPECGRTLRLGIHEDSPLWRRRSLLLLILLVIAIASGTRAARSWQSLYVSAHTLTISGVQLRYRPAAPPTADARPGRPAASDIQPFLGDVRDRPQPVTSAPDESMDRTITLEDGSTITVQGPPPQVTRTWSNVTTDQWTRSIGWSAAALIALAGLLLLWRYRRRPAPRRVSLVLHAMAWIAGGGLLVVEVMRLLR